MVLKNDISRVEKKTKNWTKILGKQFVYLQK